MNKVTKVLISVVLIVISIILFGMTVINSKNGSSLSPGFLGAIVFFILIFILRKIWKNG